MASLQSFSDAESSTLAKEKTKQKPGKRSRRVSVRVLALRSRMPPARGKSATMHSNTTPEAGSSRVPNWTPVLDAALTGTLKNQFLLGNCVQGQFTRDGWRVIPQQFNQQTGLSYDKISLQNRFKNIKKIFYQFNELCSRSGWEWDYINHSPVAPPHEPWDALLQILPQFKALRGKHFPCYQDLEIILEKATATGCHAVGSAQPVWNPPGSPPSQPRGDSQHNSEQGPPRSTNLTDQLNDLLRTSPRADAPVHPHIRNNSNFHPHFQHVIGAIDGTHILATVPRDKEARYRNRKGWISQNVMAAVGFDLAFQYVCAGWEGSAGDMKVLRWALQHGDFTVPQGKQYLVDCGYANTDTFLAPYRGYAYHLQEFNTRSTRRYRDYKELYNHRHAQLRNCVERAFGVLKMRFKYLRLRPYYDFKHQVDFVQACCVIHNFIRRQQGNDEFFNATIDTEDCDVGDLEPQAAITIGEADVRRGDAMREAIARGLWPRAA